MKPCGNETVRETVNETLVAGRRHQSPWTRLRQWSGLGVAASVATALLLFSVAGCNDDTIREIRLDHPRKATLSGGPGLPTPVAPKTVVPAPLPPFHKTLDELSGPFADEEAAVAACTLCHVGASDDIEKTVHYQDGDPVSCLACHAHATGKDADNPTKLAQSVGRSQPANCLECHDDVLSDVKSTAKAGAALGDVHLDALGFRCQTCHQTKHHRIGGAPLANGDATSPVACQDCHKAPVHKRPILNRHAQRVSCQACHILGDGKPLTALPAKDWAIGGKIPASHGVVAAKRARDCGDCHERGIDFSSWGMSADPMLGGHIVK